MNENQIAAIRAIRAGEKADGRTVAALQRREFVDDSGGITPLGWETYLDNIETSKVTTLILGCPLGRVATQRRGVFAHFPAGTRLTVVFAGHEKRGKHMLKWYDCFADERFGVVRVYHNRSHKIATYRVPKEDLHEATIPAGDAPAD